MFIRQIFLVIFLLIGTLHASTAYSATESVDDELPYDKEQPTMHKRWQSNEYEVLFDGFPSYIKAYPYDMGYGTLTIKKKNKVIYEEEIGTEPGWLSFRNQDTNPIEDVTGDGEPDLVIYINAGGAWRFNNFIFIYSLGDEIDIIAHVSEVLEDLKDMDNKPGLEIIGRDQFNYGFATVDMFSPSFIMRYDGKQYVLAPDLMKKSPLTKEELEGKIVEIKAEIGKPVQYLDQATCAPCSKEVGSEMGSFKYSDYMKNNNLAAEQYLTNIVDEIFDLIYSGRYFQAVQIIDATWPGTKEEKEAFLKDLKRDIRKDLWEMNGIN